MNIDQILRLVHDSGIEQVRIAWCDTHGELRAKASCRLPCPQRSKMASAWWARKR
ncbi:MAG: hypothetical protein HC858_08600 [Brachymonas sp.]|nr:hypothetical protein [Brachymonas sp.]